MCSDKMEESDVEDPDAETSRQLNFFAAIACSDQIRDLRPGGMAVRIEGQKWQT